VGLAEKDKGGAGAHRDDDKAPSAKTINGYKSLAESNLIPFIGAYKLKELTADNVDDWLEDPRDHLTTPDRAGDPLDPPASHPARPSER
jgi:hypothetical protein